MRVIDVSKPEKLRRITALSYGASRSGKTRFAGTWPRPLFLADATESGWTTLGNMDRNVLFEPNRPPVVWAIEKVTDMFQALKDVEPMLKRGDIQTIVVDSITFYSDRFFNYAESLAGGRGDPRQLYQKLAAHLKALCEQVHALSCNVVWLALAKDPGEDQPVGGPMLSGQNAPKFAASCDYLLYHRHFQQGAGPLQWEVRTRKYLNYAAGGRDEGLLPDPLGYVTTTADGTGEVFVPDCTYRTLAEALGILAPITPSVSDASVNVAPDPEPVAEASATPEVVADAIASNGKGKPTGRPTPPTSVQSGRTTPR
jgi:hypothetical protein